MRLIDADALIRWLDENECYTDRFKRIAGGIIENRPTVDAAAVCRCEKCTLWDRKHVSNEGLARCLNGEGGIRYRGKRDFCSKGIPTDASGERKGGDK